MKIPFFKWDKTIKGYSKELEGALLNGLRNGKHINGPEVTEIENKLGTYLGSHHCISCANGSDALTIALRALNLPQNSEVVTPSYNYVSSAESAVNLGLVPKFCDVQEMTQNTSLNLIKEQVTNKTKAVIITHLFGLPVKDVKEIATFCKSNNIFLIEDNAQSFGSLISQKRAGTFGDISTTSFFPTKNLACAGDGGAIFTDDALLAEKMKTLRSHGQEKKYEFSLPGYNSRLDTIQACVLLVNLKYLDEQLNSRKENATYYLRNLKECSNIELPILENNSFNQFTIRTKRRNELKEFLNEKGIQTMIYYPIAIHSQVAYKKYSNHSLSISENLSSQCLSLPIYPGLRREEILYICDQIQAFN